MFRRIFRPKGPGKAPEMQEPETVDESEIPDSVKQAARILQDIPGREANDHVHRMVIRAGGQKFPEDPDEQAYAEDQGEHAEIAHRTLQARDFKRSIYHLALALASDPTRDEWLVLLDQWITMVGSDALDLVPLTDKEYFITVKASQYFANMRNTPHHQMEVTPAVGNNYHAKVAVHAYILAYQGNIRDAVPLLLQLVEVKSDIPYILWMLRWQDLPGFADGRVDPDQSSSIALQLMQKYTGTYVFSGPGRAQISATLPLLHKSYDTLSHESKSESFLMTALMYAMALRKTGLFEEAAHIARAMPAISYQTQVSLAMAEGALGNLDASIAAYQKALTFQPMDVAVRNDLGTLFLNQGNLTEALALYKESVRLDASDPFHLAHAHVAYLNYLQDPRSDAKLKKLKQLAQRQGRAKRFLNLLQAPYIGRLPSPEEALINLLREIMPAFIAEELPWDKTSTFLLESSALESPSAQLASRLLLESLGVPVEFDVESLPSPDPRQPLRPVEYQIWRYEGMDPIPAVPPPDAAIAESIALLAQTPYALDRWHAPARVLGQRLGPDALMSLLGVMVHPPAIPANWEAWDWVVAVQLASALTIASIDTGWDGSLRKQALTSLIYGPMDWSGAAALTAMALLARQDQRISIEFDRICCELWNSGPDVGEWPLKDAMVLGLLFINDYSQEAQEHVDAYFAEQADEEEE